MTDKLTYVQTHQVWMGGHTYNRRTEEHLSVWTNRWIEREREREIVYPRGALV
jgi:hypothetical protein